MNLPTTAQLQAAFTAWFNKLVAKPSEIPTYTQPLPGSTFPDVSATDLTFAQVQTLLGIGATSGNLKLRLNLLQSGTNPPTADTIENTVGVVALTRVSAGSYRLIKSGAFPQTKTQIMGTATFWNLNAAVVFNRLDNDTIAILSYDISTVAAPVLADGLLSRAPIDITIAP